MQCDTPSLFNRTLSSNTLSNVRCDSSAKQAGGRLSLVELPALLGVDGVHCDRAALEVVGESGGGVVAIQGELITRGYFDGLAREVNDLLHESGQVRHH